MDRKRCLQILEDRGVGPKIQRLIQTFWRLSLLVCKAGGCYGRPFLASRGVTQGGPLSPRIFNLMVDAVICEWLLLQPWIRGGQLGHRRPDKNATAALYADNGLVQSRDPVFLQEAFNALVALFKRVGLRTNTKKPRV